jgi:hypothetical protein
VSRRGRVDEDPDDAEIVAACLAALLVMAGGEMFLRREDILVTRGLMIGLKPVMGSDLMHIYVKSSSDELVN